MSDALILINPDHRIRPSLADLTRAVGTTLIEPDGEGLPTLDAWMQLVQAHPGVPMVIDLTGCSDRAWELCRAVCLLDDGVPRSVLLTLAGQQWSTIGMLFQSAIPAPDERGGFEPLLNAVSSVLARVA